MMNETKQKGRQLVVSPSLDDYLLLSAKFHTTAEITGVLKDGRFFVAEKDFTKSLDLLEYEQTRSHTHKMGGDSVDVISIARNFYRDTNVKDVYAMKSNDELNVYLILHEEIEDMALQLASLQIDIQKLHKEVYIEIDYATEEDTYLDELENDYVKVSRR